MKYYKVEFRSIMWPDLEDGELVSVESTHDHRISLVNYSKDFEIKSTILNHDLVIGFTCYIEDKGQSEDDVLDEAINYYYKFLDLYGVKLESAYLEHYNLSESMIANW